MLPPPSGHGVVLADNLEVLTGLPDGCIDLVYIDPPFNTGRTQKLHRINVIADPGGDRTGFSGRRYRTMPRSSAGYPDSQVDYLAFLEPRLREIRRVLASHGSLYVHLDYREVHYCKVLLDQIFGRDCFLNEVIWAYDYGARSRRRWPAKHDTILVFVREHDQQYFDAESVDRIPYMAPRLVGATKSARGKLPTDTWWHTIVPTSGRERTGYPTQKPLGILRRVVAASCPPGGLVADFFAGSGTAGVAAAELGRRFLMVDNSPVAVEVQERRLLDLGIAFQRYGVPIHVA